MLYYTTVMPSTYMYVCHCSEVVEPFEDAEGAGGEGGPSAGAEVGGV